MEGNVRQKLAKARLDFLNQKVTKSGKNMHLEFKYFELEDIVPPATRIFADVGLLAVPVFEGERAVMTVYNTDNMDEPGIEFVAPYREVQTIVSNKGKEVTNAMQALGSSITYLRRYLWMMVLDISEPDEVDATLGAGDSDTAQSAAAPAAKLASPAKRKQIKEELVSEDESATDEQLAALKGLLKKLLAIDETQEEFVQQVAMKTEGLTKVAGSACDELVKYLNEMIAAYNLEDNDE